MDTTGPPVLPVGSPSVYPHARFFEERFEAGVDNGDSTPATHDFQEVMHRQVPEAQSIQPLESKIESETIPGVFPIVPFGPRDKPGKPWKRLIVAAKPLILDRHRL